MAGPLPGALCCCCPSYQRSRPFDAYCSHPVVGWLPGCVATSPHVIGAAVRRELPKVAEARQDVCRRRWLKSQTLMERTKDTPIGSAMATAIATTTARHFYQNWAGLQGVGHLPDPPGTPNLRECALKTRDFAFLHSERFRSDSHRLAFNRRNQAKRYRSTRCSQTAPALAIQSDAPPSSRCFQQASEI